MALVSPMTEYDLRKRIMSLCAEHQAQDQEKLVEEIMTAAIEYGRDQYWQGDYDARYENG